MCVCVCVLDMLDKKYHYALPCKTNVRLKILRTGRVCWYILRICVCRQGRYSIGKEGWYTPNQLCNCNKQDHLEFVIRQAAVTLLSLRCDSKVTYFLMKHLHSARPFSQLICNVPTLCTSHTDTYSSF